MVKPLGRVLMVQGTASSVGKSTLVAALCRLFAREGWRVAPFKAQNMALNSAVTADGGEIGRSTAVQAAAAGVAPTTDMNPILLKPETDTSGQVIVHGRVMARMTAAAYFSDDANRARLFEIATTSLDRLRAAYDLVVIEGAGSPAELNLRRRDIVNMAIALHARAPVILVGDINPGGIFAQLIGTVGLLPPDERALLIGTIVNRFRGDLSLFSEGVGILEEQTGLPVLGVIPFLPRLRLAEEDSMAIDDAAEDDTPTIVDIVVPRLPHISNFDDLDPLAAEPGVRVRYIDEGAQVGQPNLIVLPGTKSTMADLDWLRQRGLAAVILTCADAGVPVIGLCGGYQMMGHVIRDPDRVESDRDAMAGLGLLPAETTFAPRKTTHQVRGHILPEAVLGLLAGAAGAAIDGYEIHMGMSTGNGRGLAELQRLDTGETVLDGLISWDGSRFGTYVHGLFENNALRSSILASLGLSAPARRSSSASRQDSELDRLADHVAGHLDLDTIHQRLGLPHRP